jgi:hypothetical protein
MGLLYVSLSVGGTGIRIATQKDSILYFEAETDYYYWNISPPPKKKKNCDELSVSYNVCIDFFITDS